MAILPAVPGLDVCLRVDGELALERTAAGDEVVMEDRYVVKYIECRPGSKFGVSIEFAPLFTYYTWTTMAAHIYIDGALTNRRTFPKHRLVGDFLEEITGAEDFDNNGEQVQREFVFAATEIVEDNDEPKFAEEEAKHVDSIGEIKFCFFRKEEIGVKR